MSRPRATDTSRSHAPNPSPEWESRWAERLFRASLYLYPRHHRQAYGSEMLEHYRRLAEDARRAGGLTAWKFAAAALVDAFTGAGRAHAWSQRSQTQSPPNRSLRHGQEASTMTTLKHDFTVSLRRLRSNPTFTLVVALTLALGIGANTAIFSVVYGVLLRPLGLEGPQELVLLDLHRTDVTSDSMGFWPTHMEVLHATVENDQAQQAGTVRNLTSFLFDSTTLEGKDRAEEVGPAVMVDGQFFATLGVEPILGRSLGPRDVQPDRRGDVCVLGESWWRQRFAGDRQILGRSLILDGKPVEVVGVMPDDIPLPRVGVQLWMTQGWDLEDPALYGRLQVLARLGPGSGPNQATGLLAQAMPGMVEKSPRLSGYTISLQSFQDSLVGTARPTLVAVAGAVGLILLLACANIASLLLARAAGREQEMATRRALGAHRRQMASQLLIESLLLASLGGLAGVGFAIGLHRILLVLAAGLLPRLQDVRLDLPVLAFAAAASLATGVVFGLAPVLYSWSRDLATAMRGARSSARPGLSRARSALVVAQVALAVILTLGAALTVKSLLALRAVDPGFDIRGIGAARIYLDDDAYPEDAEQALYFDQLIDRLRARPDIVAVGASSALPMDPSTIDYDLPYLLPGEDAADEDAQRQAYFRIITPGYLETVDIPLLRGRPFAATDGAEGEPVVLINETFARLGWPDRDPVGESFSIYSGRRTMRIIGVVGNIRFAGPADSARAEFYVPHTQFSYGAMTVVAQGWGTGSTSAAELGGRSSIGGGALRDPAADAAAQAIAAEAAELDRRQPVHSTTTLAELSRGTLAISRFVSLMLVAFAAVALCLSAAGIYGVLSGWVAESRTELGVRIALGASATAIVGLVLRRSLWTAGAGLVLGLLTVQLATRALLPFLFGVDAHDLASLAVAVCLLVLVAVLASLAPAIHAARVQPTDVLRLG